MFQFRKTTFNFGNLSSSNSGQRQGAGHNIVAGQNSCWQLRSITPFLIPFACAVPGQFHRPVVIA